MNTERRFKFFWIGGKSTEGNGFSVSDAFSKLGYGAGAVAALDYYEEVPVKEETPMTTPTKQHDSGATNDRQTSERERLATVVDDLGSANVPQWWTRKAADQLRADEAEIAQLHRLVELRSNEAVDNLDEAIRLREEIAALRAENEALRTDATRYRELRQGDLDDIAIVHGIGTSDSGISGVVYTYESELTGDELDKAIDVRSKESSRG